MPYLYPPAPLRSLTGGSDRVAVAGTTVGEAIDDADRRHPGLKERLVRDGALVPGLQVSIDDVLTKKGLRAAVGDESEIHFLPPIGGG